MHTLLALLLFVVVFVVPNQVIAEDGGKEIVNKRQVSVLARDGHLPYEGKRYVGEKNEESKTSQNSWDADNSDNDPSVFLMTNKRYVGALAKTGDLARYKQQNDKREDVDTLIDELLTAEELRRIRLEALREELLKQQEEAEAEEVDAEKRSLASLAKSGGFRFRDDKRNVASMARAGYFRSPNNFLPNDEYEKRGIPSLARNGQLPSFGKRGGISSIMRNGYPNQKRNVDSDLDSLLYDDYDIDDKRNVASLARGYSLPSMGKKNIASFARNGWLQDFGPISKRPVYDKWDEVMDESKRNLPSLLRNRVSPLVEGKRYLGAFLASNRLPYRKESYEGSKRNIGAMARNWNFPESYRYGKRDWYEDDIGNDEIAKRYVSSLLKQGPLPISSENVETNSEDNQSYSGEQQNKDENTESMEEQKRHIGSLLAQKSFAMRKKKSISLEDQFGETPPTTSVPTKSRSDENKMSNDIQQNHRQKREAFAEFTAASDEYPMPVMQANDISEYDDGNSRASTDEQSTRKKRYFALRGGAVRGGGKIPGGRLPHVGRSRSNNPNSGRRRH